MHIISASRRTDIPAFHSEWFMNRIRAGYAKVRSPFGGKIYNVSLSVQDVITIVFWTKNAFPLIENLRELSDRGYNFSFLYTINNFPPNIEPRVTNIKNTMNTIDRIAKEFSPSILRWRYDTIVLSGTIDNEWHLKNFGTLCVNLNGYVDNCIFSFCDYYNKVLRNMDKLEEGYVIPSHHECSDLAENLARIALRSGISMESCAHDYLTSGQISKAKCIDSNFLQKNLKSPERIRALSTLKKVPTRKGCACVESKDIGAYDTCGHGCIYCYANADPVRALQNLSRISPDSDILWPQCKRTEEDINGKLNKNLSVRTGY
jgi:hypothetical protein